IIAILGKIGQHRNRKSPTLTNRAWRAGDDKRRSSMTESQIDRIRKAEEAVRELIEIAAQIRQEADKLPIDDPSMREELLEAAEGYEIQVQDLRDALRRWREDIH